MPPKHVAFIMDGNRRFSRRLMEKPWKGHEWGAKKLREVLEWCRAAGVEEATFYALSMQNLDRPRIELDYLFKLGEKVADRVLSDPSELLEHGVRVSFVGRREVLPDALQQKMARMEDLTRECAEYRLNFAVAYGGREEIVDAVRSLVRDGVPFEEVSMESLSERMYLQSPPDLVIRTGGDHRTSNFLVWQSWYSEWCFVDHLWPEFSEEDFRSCIDRFDASERRFGR